MASEHANPQVAWDTLSVSRHPKHPMSMPMPGGVPETITSPGMSVIKRLVQLTIWITSNTILLVLPVCIRSPFTSSQRSRLFGSGTSSHVTNQGPSGPNVSHRSPLSQVGLAK
jgi:hypothetical protein